MTLLAATTVLPALVLGSARQTKPPGTDARPDTRSRRGYGAVPDGTRERIVERMEEGDALELQELRYHWGGAYTFSVSGDGQWWLARRRDNQRQIATRGASALWDQVRADYAQEPVSREFDRHSV